MEISKYEEKKRLPEDGKRKDLEKNNFVFPPAYSRGKRKIQFPIGIDSLGNVYTQEMQRVGSTCAAFLTGKEDSGKYSFLENVINYLVMSYHPDDVELWIMDLKGIEQFTNIIEHRPPHIKYLLVSREETMVFSFLDRIEKEYKRRINFLNNVGRAEEYRNCPKWMNVLDVPKEVYFPSIFVIINEVSILSQAIEKMQGSRYMKDYKVTLQNILTQSRAAGFHFIFANQKFASGLSGFSNIAMEQIRVRMAMSAVTALEIQETLNIPRRYLTERQISWIDDLSQNQILLCPRLLPIGLEEIEKPSIEKVKIFNMSDEERKLQYKRFDWLKQKMVESKKYEQDRIDSYVEKHPIIYNGEHYMILKKI